MEPHPPQIPEHELLRVIGRGSYGEVWLARSVTGAHRAVKIIRRDQFGSDAPYEREFEGVRRFEEVSRDHAGLVDLYLVGRHDAERLFYYVMALADDVSGADEISAETYEPHTLQADLEQGEALPIEQCLRLGQTVALALEHLHVHGLVHRDVKPSNLIRVQGRYCLADIGMVTEPSGTEAFVGTHGYLPREGAGQPTADLFALGRVLYEASTGQDRQHFPVLPESMRGAALTQSMKELNKVCLKTCAHEPVDRYADATALAADLKNIAEGGRAQGVREKPVWRWVAAAIFVGLLGWGIWPEPPEAAPARSDGLWLHWKFDGDLRDATGQGRDARAEWVQPVEDRHGRPARALKLSASSTLALSERHDWAAIQPRTLSMWFRVNAWQESPPGWFQDLASPQSASLATGLGFAVQLKGNGLVGLDGNYICAMFRAPLIDTHRWHHLAVTSEGATQNARVWLNGESLEALGKDQFWWKPDLPWREVKQAVFAVPALEGAVDEVRVYKRALAEREILALYAEEKPRQLPVASEEWDETIPWAALEPGQSQAIKHHTNLRHVQEGGSGSNYWAPKDENQTAEIVYHFTFPRAVKRAHLSLPMYLVDLTPARNKPVRGAAAVEVSADEEQWLTVFNGMEPQMRWGEGFGAGKLMAELSAGALGAKSLHLRVRLRAEGGAEHFSPVQFGRPPNGAGDEWAQEPVLRVKLAAE